MLKYHILFLFKQYSLYYMKSLERYIYEKLKVGKKPQVTRELFFNAFQQYANVHADGLLPSTYIYDDKDSIPVAYYTKGTKNEETPDWAFFYGLDKDRKIFLNLVRGDFTKNKYIYQDTIEYFYNNDDTWELFCNDIFRSTQPLLDTYKYLLDNCK